MPRFAILMTLRTTIVWGVVLAMPLLAIPRVNRCLNGWLRCEATAPHVESSRLAAAKASVSPRDYAELAAAPSVQLQDQPTLDQLLQIRDQLERYGADYMRLEARPEQRQYWFHCRVRLPASMIYSRVFEASGADPRQAMDRVLAEVLQWRQVADSSRFGKSVGEDFGRPASSSIISPVHRR